MRQLVSDRVRGLNRGDRGGRRALVARVHVGERLSGGDGVTPLLATDDSNSVVDVVVLGAPSRP